MNVIDKQELTHIVPCSGDAVTKHYGYAKWRALCGQLVESTQFARDGDPSCAECKRIDDEDTVSLAALREA